MKIKNIEDLKSSINWSILAVFCLIFGLSLFGLFFIHNKFLQKQSLYDNQQIVTAENVYKSNLSEKLSIIASSIIFLDFLRSGEETRERLYPQFLSQLSTLKVKSIAGMQIIDRAGKIIFYNGKKTDSSITLDLCYLNQTLDRKMGICEFAWRIFFNKNILLSELLNLNNTLHVCNKCDSHSLINDGIFGSFSAKNPVNLDLNIKAEEDNDYYFYIYLLLVAISLAIFSSWTWYRLSNILNNYIANPLKDLADCLKADEVVERDSELKEIQYLVNEINTWKGRVNKAKEDEQTARLAKIGAQLAHDIRSPLMAIDMISKKFTSIPDNYKNMLQQATDRISDIANNFLVQYKRKSISKQVLARENILELLECIIAEKREQYSGESVVINFNVASDDENFFCYVNSIDFKRVISNLINNAVEASQGGGVSVTVNLLSNDKNIIIKIIDNGKGISPQLMPNIFNGVSQGKQNGTGLGLSHAKTTIEEWHGSLNIRSQVGIGSQVSILLPACL